MNIFASLEEVLAPVGETKAPMVGLKVDDWDENVSKVADQFVSLGYGVQLIPKGVKYSGEQLVNGVMEKDPEPDGREPAMIFYYKGVPEDGSEGIPVLVAEDGKVKVSVEGRMKELAEHLGLLEDPDNDSGDHEYR